MKKCIRCKIEKPEEDFHKAPRNTDGRCGQCKVCKSALSKVRWRGYSNEEKKEAYQKQKVRIKRNPDKRKQVVRRHRLKKKYGLTESAYSALLLEQDDRCAICRDIMSATNIDHNHKTGKVRGILCSLCNPGLGNFRDSETFLLNAIEYLRKHN